MPRRTGSMQRWRARQERDVYVEQAVRGGWRARAVFKLEQIQAKERLLRAGTICVDLGSAPGSWSQLAAQLVGPTGRVVAVDLLPMEPIPGVDFLEGDFTTPATLEAVRELIGSRPVDLVMSDMAPNISGNRAMDQPRSMALLDEALLFAREVLRPGGDFLVKAFQGEGIAAFTRELKAHFKTVKTIKPKASRPESREIYLLARSFGM
jgi:23S rRNA (uridine2552-2'-O)-methyltransferase